MKTLKAILLKCKERKERMANKSKPNASIVISTKHTIQFSKLVLEDSADVTITRKQIAYLILQICLEIIFAFAEN
jgi:hypothetical protein